MKRMAVVFSLALFLVSLAVPSPLLAAKSRTSRGSGTTVSSGTTSGRVLSSVRFKANRLGIIINFSGLTNASSVTYGLTYNTNGPPQGARGTITNPTVSADSRELLFGTCSKNVCRWHTGITEAKVVITSKLKSGLTTRKTFRLKV